MPVRRASIIVAALAAAAILLAGPALAQIAHHPFAIGAKEGAIGRPGTLGAWLLAQESGFYRQLTSAVRAAASGGGFALLIGLSFAYGVFHAAGPGHGKAVITSYLVSNEVALRRGMLVALMAALLQGALATAIVGIAAFVFDATAMRMTAAAQAAELASYLVVIGLGMVLVWRKGRALVAVLRPAEAAPFIVTSGGTAALAPPPSRFFADDGAGHMHDATCGCGGAHMPDPSLMASRSFSWKVAAGAAFAAGARPCSGAILVLVFSLSQGLFAAGIAATFAMALGTAVTTGALAAAAVFAKDTAVRLTGGARSLLIGRLVEFGAAACVLLFGLALLAAALSGATGAG